MAYYMIHGCLNRKEYMDKYLIPSLVEQGISKNHIIRILDVNREGCLAMYKKAYSILRDMFDTDAGVWHIQDDVIISRTFKEMTESHDEGVVCGFCSGWFYDKTPGGVCTPKDMWYSSPCIRIPVGLSTQFIEWLDKCTDKNVLDHIEQNKGEDYLFKLFLKQVYPDMPVLNLVPNLVDHVDYLLGWSVVNRQRGQKIVRSSYWEEHYRTEALKMRLGITT